MICPSCESEVADSSIMCPICGEPVAKRPSYFGLSYGDVDYSNDRSLDIKPVKKQTNIMSIIIGVLALVIVVLGGMYLYKNVINKAHKYDGKYTFDSVYYQGQSISEDFYSQATGFDFSGYYIKIDGKKAYMGWDTFGDIEVQIPEFENNNGKIKLLMGDSEFTGTIHGKELTLHVKDEGVEGDIVFKR